MLSPNDLPDNAPAVPPETRKKRLIRSLRQFADFLENKCVSPKFDEPFWVGICWYNFREKHELASAIQEVGGMLHKRFNDRNLALKREFGEIEFSLDIPRDQVCRKVVTKKRVPARPEVTLPAQPEREEEVVEWQCDEPILKGM